MEPSGRKIKCTCTHMAKCGLTSFSRCKNQNAGLPECIGCELVTRRVSRLKVINGRIYSQCRCCGELRPLSMFYPKKYKKPGGRVYETHETMCKICRSKEYYRKRKMELCMRY